MRQIVIYIVLIIVIGALAILLFSKPPKALDTHITFKHTDKIPYGTYVAYQLLQKQYPKATLVINKESPSDWILDKNNDSANKVLIIINSYFNPSESEIDKLTAFAQKGNVVIISALQMNDMACKYYGVEQNNYYESEYGLSGNSVSYRTFDSLKVVLDSATFGNYDTCTSPGTAYDNYFYNKDSTFAYSLGYNAVGKANFLAIRTIHGTIFLHAAPMVFTNLFLLSNQNYHYYEKLLSLLPKNPKQIIWDDYFLHKKSYQSDNNNHKWILSVLLQYENFRWAIVIALVALLFYVITEAKRKQRIIPLYQKPVNESLDFVSTIGKLYYEKADHKNLAEKLITLFLDFIRQQYKIPTNTINTALAEAIAAKSGVPLPNIVSIINTIQFIQLSHEISGVQLADFHKQLENFYKNA